uniref:Nitrilase n=1 Tax=uncultured organism TaxID=155900 RepID=Q6RWG5_9ZZZZ|nr:nitrilase [uncultured organism]
MTTKSIRIAAVQAAPAFLDLAGTLDRLEAWARKAAATGARVIAFPETWLPGYPAWIDSSPEAAIWGHPGSRDLHQRLMENAVEVPGPATARIAKLAGELGVTIVVGAHERAGNTLYNTALTFGPEGRLLNHHRKLVPTYSERLLWGYGDGAGLVAPAVDGVKVGALVCWEHWMPLTRQAMHDVGEHVHVALWPGVHEMHQVASRHYAFEGRCFVIAVGSILRVDQMPKQLPPLEKYAKSAKGLMIAGGSAIIAPNGRYVAAPVYDEETIVTADCDLGEIPREAQTLDVSGHYSRPDVFSFGVVRHRPRA